MVSKEEPGVFEEKGTNGQKEKAPPETYDYLNRYRGRTYNHPTKLIGCSIREEQFCKETGGSCMDLLIKQRDHGIDTQWHTHITDKNEVAELSGYVHNLYTGEYTIFQPDITDMISMVEDVRSQFVVDSYERPL